jgi:hydrogenase expression/formation protein HypD
MKTDPDYKNRLLEAICNTIKPAALMEVCGTHTMAIARTGIRDLLPPHITLLSGPGCPVCVTSQGDIDTVISLVLNHNITLLTFGDMMRVPGSECSLQEARSQGADVRVVYSPLDALQMAQNNPGREMVFLGIGFETTAPAVAHTIIEAQKLKVTNFSVLSLHKLVPPALETLFADKEIKVDGLICPGHVSMIIGLKPYQQLAAKFHQPCVVTGFEAVDILESICMLLQQIGKGQARIENQYKRVVRPQGNPIALKLLEQVFEPVEARWRGLGAIPGSGLAVRDRYANYDAVRRYGLIATEDRSVKGCSCGSILTGKISPPQCALFGRACTPLNPVGPCMVSQEGACAAYYRYAPMKG